MATTRLPNLEACLTGAAELNLLFENLLRNQNWLDAFDEALERANGEFSSRLREELQILENNMRSLRRARGEAPREEVHDAEFVVMSPSELDSSVFA